jgi:flavodoxin I
MKLAIVYTSVTGNTKELAEEIYRISLRKSLDTDMYRIEEFQESYLLQYDAIVIGTYTWGNGEIPKEMWRLYHMFESLKRKDMTTAVFGTGDSFYPEYCGAVDGFRDMLFVHTNLAATLKVELMPQQQDIDRCQKFVESIVRHASKKKIQV